MWLENTHSVRSHFRSAAIILTLLVVITLGAAILSNSLSGTADAQSPMQAAAQAAANDLSTLVIYHPKFGIVGMTDVRPPGSDTTELDATDKAPFVIGINTLFGSVKHDLCIEAQSTLLQALQKAAQPNGTGIDYDGHVINPTEDAINAYNARAGFLQFWRTQKLIPGSLKISLVYKSAQTALREPLIVKVEADEQRSKTIVTSVEPDCQRVTSHATIEVSHCAAIAQALEYQSAGKTKP